MASAVTVVLITCTDAYPHRVQACMVEAAHDIICYGGKAWPIDYRVYSTCDPFQVSRRLKKVIISFSHFPDTVMILAFRYDT